jgi:hypothetical protein
MSNLKRRKEKNAAGISLRENPGVSFKDEPPKFSLRYVQPDYCISLCKPSERLDFVNAMLKRKDRAWKHLESDPHQGLGCEVIRNGVNVRIPDCAKDKAILSFKFSGKKSMVGFRERDIFYILWFDRDFSVYDHD